MKPGVANQARSGLAIIFIVVALMSFASITQLVDYQPNFLDVNERTMNQLGALQNIQYDSKVLNVESYEILSSSNISADLLSQLQTAKAQHDRQHFLHVKQSLIKEIMQSYRTFASDLDVFTFKVAFWLGAMFMTVILGIIAVYALIERSILKRVFHLQKAMEALEEGKKVALPTQGQDEISRMAKSVERASQQLLSQKQQLLDAYEEQTLLIKMFSHEYRTPLSIINSALNLLNKEISDETPKRRLAAMTRATKRLKEIVDVSLNENRTKSWVVEDIENAHCDAVTCIKESIALQQQVYPKNLIDFHYDGQCALAIAGEDFAVCMDNIIGNALKYSGDDSSVTIECQRNQLDAQITVKDEGMGIDKELQERIFEKYFRSPNTSTIVGAGLGLHIVRSIVDQYNGSINVQSTPGHGSLFTLVLPIYVSDK